MMKRFLFIYTLLFLISCSDDPFKGLNEDDKLIKYESIKREILMQWTCNYFNTEVFDYLSDKKKNSMKFNEKYFYEYPLHFYGARDNQKQLTEIRLRNSKVPTEYWDVSEYKPFKISELPCQEKIIERENLKYEWQTILEKSRPK
jgi:hypothetical protein